MTCPRCGACPAQGSEWFGVHTLQNPIDAVSLAGLLWKLAPDLVVEVGTECESDPALPGERSPCVSGALASPQVAARPSTWG
mmetsp:Transcript_5378/g.17812  ORF Transcript_5378/g.17812 Transcript_5378/m.17812 type:complete len:82 (+) Transcript_5378:399-644(+)